MLTGNSEKLIGVFIEYGSEDTYEMTFRVVRFPLSQDSYECVVTNLLAGLMNFHSRKPESIKKEIWAKFITYNATELLIGHVEVKKSKTKYAYQVSFTAAAHICRIYLRIFTKADSIDVMLLLSKEVIPIRDEYQYERL